MRLVGSLHPGTTHVSQRPPRTPALPLPPATPPDAPPLSSSARWAAVNAHGASPVHAPSSVPSSALSGASETIRGYGESCEVVRDREIEIEIVRS